MLADLRLCSMPLTQQVENLNWFVILSINYVSIFKVVNFTEVGKAMKDSHLLAWLLSYPWHDGFEGVKVICSQLWINFEKVSNLPWSVTIVIAWFQSWILFLVNHNCVCTLCHAGKAVVMEICVVPTQREKILGLWCHRWLNSFNAKISKKYRSNMGPYHREVHVFLAAPPR